MLKNEVLEYLHEHANESVKKHLTQRKGSFQIIGVAMKDIRALAAKIKQDEALAIDLYETHIFEAMMLATMMMPEDKLTLSLLKSWALSAESSQIIDQGLSPLIMRMQDKSVLIQSWYLDHQESLRYAGYSLFSSYFRGEPLDKIDIPFSIQILEEIKNTIATEPLLIQNAMNNAVVMAGLHVPRLVDKATEVAKHIGHVMPLVARNQCNIQSAYDYLIRYKDNPTYSRVARLNKVKS